MIVLLPKPKTRWTPTGNDDSMLAAYNRGDTSKLFVLNRDVEDSGKIFFSSYTQRKSGTSHKINRCTLGIQREHEKFYPSLER